MGRTQNKGSKRGLWRRVVLW